MVHFIRTETRLTRPDPSAKVLRAADHTSLIELRKVLEAAHAEADSIVGGAEAAVAKERARGYAEGREEALTEASAQMVSTVTRTVEYYGHVEDRMLQLVLDTTRRLMDDFGDVPRARAVVKSALSAVRNQKQVTLRVSPAQVATVQQAQVELLAAYPGVGYLDVVADPRLAADACILESEIGIVEASVQGQLAALRKAFAKVLGSRT